MGVLLKMTEEQRYYEELERIAVKIYGQHYGELCFAMQRNVQTLLKTGDI